MIKAVFLDCFGVLYQRPELGYRIGPHEKEVIGLLRNQALIDYSQTLRGNYKLGVISNCARDLFAELFSDEERKQYFDTVVVSDEVGLDKPQPEIYYLACQRLGIRPEEAIMVDDLEVHCNGALGVGMQAVLYRSNEQAEQELEKLLHA